jgi:hypothetical protein
MYKQVVRLGSTRFGPGPTGTIRKLSRAYLAHEPVSLHSPDPQWV